MNIKKMLTFFTIFLFIGLAFMPVMDSRTIDAKNTKNFFEDRYKESVIYIEAASPYDYGLKVGRRLRLQYKLLDILAGFTEKNRINEKDIKDQINAMEDYCPFYLEELRGLSDSLGIKIERLISISYLVSKIFDRSCTTTLSTGPATKYNETFVTQNLDNGIADNFKDKIVDLIEIFLLHLSTYKLWVVRINTLRYKYAFFGLPILREYPIINEMGLGFGMNGIRFTDNESRYKDMGPGISSFQLARFTIMTCKNVSEVASLYKSVERRTGPDNFAWCDKEGGILMIESTHNYIITVFGNSTEITNTSEGILWSANHHQWLDPNLTGSVFLEEYPSSALRAERARELLEENYGNITLEVCKQITRDHNGGFDKNKKDSGDICRHPDKNQKTITAFSWIVQPKKMTVYWTHRSPCRSIFWKYDLSKIFGK